ncbi:MAG: carboxypeptidase regulatory-like domain-containing protein, partial [Acidobacteria bacterium]|nr:carboxypeptidase regulatory-like domain-containing protein [Acidobacteriota bacterium]
YYRVFQDWRAWTQEGTLDILTPMIFKQEHIVSVRAQYDDWLTFTKELAQANNRHSVPGLGVYLNSIEGSLRQTRRALARPPFETSNAPAADGVIFYALGNTLSGVTTNNSTNAAVANNPFSYPTPGISTPKRTNADFFAALRTGASANVATRFEDSMLAPLFPTFVPVPEMLWKSQPTEGYVMGFAKRVDNTPLDGATVTITNLNTGSTRTTVTDGSGFYGGLKLKPGRYLVKAVLNNEMLYSCVAEVSAGTVTTADLHPETTAPTTSAVLNPSPANGSNGWYVTNVTVSLSASDDCSGVAATEYSSDGVNWTPYTGSISISDEGATTVSYRSTDRAGNTEVVKTVTVQIDKTVPTINLKANPSRIYPPNGQSVTVTLSGVGSDAISGLASVSYVVTDEYGTTMNIPTRTLSGNSASWTDSLIVEASRRGDDLDGRLYRVVATITDAAGNTSTATADIVIEHDRGNH